MTGQKELLKKIHEFIEFGIGFHGDTLSCIENEFAKPKQEPFAYLCPSGCGCTWRDNHDGTMSLFGKNSKSCEICERLPLSELTKLYTSPQQQEPLSDDEIKNLIQLARRTLWIALCWNEHNFDDYIIYAKSDVCKTGINSVNDANDWLENIENRLTKEKK